MNTKKIIEKVNIYIKYFAGEFALSLLSLFSSTGDDLLSSSAKASKLGEDPKAGGGCKLFQTEIWQYE